MPYRLKTLIDGELVDGEELIWTGQPRPGRFAIRSLPIVLFGIPWTAFAVFWTCGAAGFKLPDFSSPAAFFPLFGLPFVLIGIGMLTSPVWMMCKAKRTVYAITDRRAIILRSGWSTDVRSFDPEDLRDLRRKERRDGSGDIVIAHDVVMSGRHGPSRTAVGFLAIPNVREVERLLVEIARQDRPE